uniref:DUF86 domain-containing protein n=1 Tax=Steinernema glaseri TaxID=37863 RepID=A0A1I8AQE7_9BILA
MKRRACSTGENIANLIRRASEAEYLYEPEDVNIYHVVNKVVDVVEVVEPFYTLLTRKHSASAVIRDMG